MEKKIITGDMPTPVKYISSKMSNVYKEVEQRAEKALLTTLPEQLRNRYSEYFTPDEQTYQFVKAADKISALLKCIQEIRAGNKDFVTARESTEKKIRQIPLKSVQYFMDNMLSAYFLTLDELNLQ